MEPMTVLVAGAHGGIGRILVPLLVARSHDVRGLVRRDEQHEVIAAAGGEPMVVDLERASVNDLTTALDSVNAVVFTAGAGPGSGAARKISVDLEGAVKFVEACEIRGVDRFVMVSAMAAHDPDAAPDALRPYLVAKGGADARLRRSSLAWTIVRPGRLTDDPSTGRVDAAPSLGRRGEIARADVALTLVEVLERPTLAGHTFELLAGDTPVVDALDALSAPPATREPTD